jgi:hypothetical protein
LGFFGQPWTSLCAKEAWLGMHGRCVLVT